MRNGGMMGKSLKPKVLMLASKSYCDKLAIDK